MTIAHCYIQQPAMQDSTTVRAPRPGTTTAGLSTGKETATSGCNQPHQAFHPVSIHQMASPERVRSTHPINSLLVIYGPQKDERLSWPSWLICSGRFTHISACHPSATGRAQDRDSSKANDRRSTTVLLNQPSTGTSIPLADGSKFPIIPLGLVPFPFSPSIFFPLPFPFPFSAIWLWLDDLGSSRNTQAHPAGQDRASTAKHMLMPSLTKLSQLTKQQLLMIVVAFDSHEQWSFTFASVTVFTLTNKSLVLDDTDIGSACSALEDSSPANTPEWGSSLRPLSWQQAEFRACMETYNNTGLAVR